MRRATLTVGMSALAGVCAVGAPTGMAATSATADTQATTTLSGSAAPVTSDRLGGDAVRGSRSQTVQVWMAGHQQAAQQFADAVSTPGSPTYHQYLSPSAYTQRFGPSAAQVRAVHSYLSRAGFTKVQTSINDDYVSATAPVSTINQVFSVQMRRYRIRGAGATSATIKSNDRDLTVPTWISSDILVVTGLNSTQPEANDTPTATGTGATVAACSHYWAQKTKAITPAFRGLTEAAVAVCGYSATQVRAAYGLTSANTGQGKTIALIEEGAPYRMFQTLTDYAKANGLRAPRSHQYRQEAIGGRHTSVRSRTSRGAAGLRGRVRDGARRRPADGRRKYLRQRRRRRSGAVRCRAGAADRRWIQRRRRDRIRVLFPRQRSRAWRRRIGRLATRSHCAPRPRA